MTGPFINRTDPADAQDRLAASYEKAAAAFASEFSTEEDPGRREVLGQKVRHNRDQAAFCREQASRLRGEASDGPAQPPPFQNDGPDCI